jgi:hypothetical protein
MSYYSHGSHSPPMASHMPYHPRRLAEEIRATAEQILWERARWDGEFAYKIRIDPVYYRGKLREQIYALEHGRRRRPVRLPLPQSFVDN